MLKNNLYKKKNQAFIIALIVIVQFCFAIDPIVLPVKSSNKKTKDLVKPKAKIIDEHDHERANVAYPLMTSGNCVSGTVNRFSGSYHSNLYIGNSNGSNVLLGWGQNMALYTTGSGTNITSPSEVLSSSYGNGIPYEVRSASTGGAGGESALALRTSNKLFVFGTTANYQAITSISNFGGTSLIDSNSDVTSKLPNGIAITDISQMAITNNAFALVTNTGEVWMLSKNKNLVGEKYNSTSSTSVLIANTGSKTFTIETGLPWGNGDIMTLSSTANSTNNMTLTVTAYNSSTGVITATATAKSGSGTFTSWNATLSSSNNISTKWHKVKLSDGVTALSGVTKFSLSSSGAFALTSTGKIYYWGYPANVNGIINTTTSYDYAYDMSAQIPSGTNVNDLVCLGKTGSTLFLLCSNNKVYGCGLNTNGVLGINNSTYTTNQVTFQPVKGIDGTTDLSDIVRIDGDTEADIFTMGAMTSDGKIYGWGDDQMSMLGYNSGHSSAGTSYPTPKTVQLFSSGTAPTSGYADFSIAGHFTIAFYHTETVGATQGVDQYWYLGHNSGSSLGKVVSGTNIYNTIAAYLNSSAGVTFDCSNTQPTITVTGTLSAFNSCNGLASPTQTLSVSGANLSDNITITAPSGFEVSTSSGSGFGTTATLTQSSSTVSATTVYVRITSSASGTPSGNISCTSTGATTVTVAVSGTVNSLPTVTSTTGASRTGTGILTLTGIASTSATLDWYANSTGGSVLSGGTGTLSFITPSISVTTNYFAQARNTSTGCVSSARTLTTATINGSFAAGTIGFDQSICNGATPSGFTSVADATGGTGSISYQWQSSIDNTTFNNISGATLATYTPLTGITQTTYYRRAASTSTDSAVYSSVITITVTALPTASSPVDNSRTGAGPVIISATASAGATLDWYANSTGGSVLSGGNGVLTFTTPSISTTTTYFAQARNTTTGCLSSSRIAVLATINGSFSAGSISADQTICSGSTPSGLTSVTDASGGTGTRTYQWQVSTSSSTSGFNDISGATSATYNPSSLSTTTYYKRGVTTITDRTIYSNVITITVNPLPSSPTGTNGSSSGTGTVAISGSVNAGETIDWYANSTGGSPLSGGTGTTSFTTPSISSTTIYYAQARNTSTGCVSASRTAVTASISANATPTITTSGTLNAFTSCLGFVSSEQSFSVSGIDLVADIVVTAPSGYELSLTSGGSFTNAITLTQTSSTVGATTIYVRLKSDATSGASGNIFCSSTNASSIDISTGTATIGATNYVVSNALNFDGSNDYIINNLDANGLNVFSIEMYIKPNNSQSGVGLFQWGNQLGTGIPMVLFQQRGNSLHAYVNSGYNLNTTIPIGSWSHIALTYNGTLYKLYLNGALVMSYTGSISFQNTATNLYFGNGYNGFWNGSMDEVRVWNSERTQAQIQEFMNSELSGSESGLLTYFNFNQGTANANNTSISSLTDNSGSNHPASFNNMILNGNSSNFVTGVITNNSISALVQNICVNGSAIALSSSLSGPGITYQWYTNTTSSNTGGTLIANANSRSYTPPTNAVGTNYYYVVVTNAFGCESSSSVSGAVNVNAIPTIALSSSTTDVSNNVNSQNTSISYSGTTGNPTNYSITWNSSPINSFAAISDASLISSPISIAIPAGANVGTYTGTLTVKNASDCTSSNNNFTLKINSSDNIPPTITHPISQTISDNCSIMLSENTSYVTTYTANETVTWSITGGIESSLFNIDATTGILTFNSPYPQYANPTDSTPTNSYIVEVTATDNGGNATNQLLTVNISPFCGNWGN